MCPNINRIRASSPLFHYLSQRLKRKRKKKEQKRGGNVLGFVDEVMCFPVISLSDFSGSTKLFINTDLLGPPPFKNGFYFVGENETGFHVPRMAVNFLCN